MARYRITSLNYLTSGDERTFLNMDYTLDYELYVEKYLLDTEKVDYKGLVQTDEGEVVRIPTRYLEKEESTNDDLQPFSTEESQEDILLHERQKYLFEIDSANRKFFWLYLAGNTIDLQKKIIQFNADREKYNQTFVIEENERESDNKNKLKDTNNVNRKIDPYYDITDVCVKSSQTKTMNNASIHNCDGAVDVYSPAMEQNQPLGFVQVNGESYMLTDETKSLPKQLQTDFIDRRLGDQSSNYYNYRIRGDQIPTFLYTPKSQFPEGSTDYDILKTPKYDLQNIRYHYVMEMAQDKLNKSVKHDYDKGDIYGYPSLTKSFHNACYTMDMPSQTEIDKCRTYVEINITRGSGSQRQPYLKFYDDTDYEGVGQTSSSGTSGIRDISLQEKARLSYPYQKIEYYYPSVFSNKAKHKSTLFSVNIDAMDIDSEIDRFQEGGDLYPDSSVVGKERESKKIECRKTVELMERIKMDIKAGVREIVNNVAPANTQLFDVYFS